MQNIVRQTITSKAKINILKIFFIPKVSMGALRQKNIKNVDFTFFRIFHNWKTRILGTRPILTRTALAQIMYIKAGYSCIYILYYYIYTVIFF